MMTVYQLRATGILRGFHDERSIFSKKIFTSEKAALEHEPKFRELVTNEDEFITLAEPVFIGIHQLELDASLITIDFPGGKKNGN